MNHFLANNQQMQADELIYQTSPHLSAISLNNFLTSMRIDDNVSTARSLRQLKSAVYAINEDISSFVNGLDKAITPKQQHIYEDAIYNRAKAGILENYRDIETTRKGDAVADKMELRIDDYLQKSREAVRLLTHKSRMTVELI